MLSSSKDGCKDAVNTLQNGDVSEKVFRANKSYLRNHCLKWHQKDGSNKIFIVGFLADLSGTGYTALKEKAKELAKKPNYLTDFQQQSGTGKIEMTRQLDKVYRRSCSSKTAEVITDAFGMDWNHVKYRAENISKIWKGVQ